jgi:hypothetical protein
MNQYNSSEISKTFFTTPRDGYSRGNLWIKRKEEDKLSSLLDNLGESICIDGPTGTGKSSLAITILKQKKIDFILIQVTKNMSWKDFCRKIFNSKVNENNTLDIGLETGIEKGLPLFKVHFGIKATNNSLEDLEYEDKLIEKMTDDKICNILYTRKLTLLIDDFERASDEILSNVGEMCKLVTESYISTKTRLVIVGTDDIYKRLTTFNKSLEGRLKELSLGTIENRFESWTFLTQGFDRLNLKHPDYELRKKIGSTSTEDIKACKDACYDAADGLLKSINELGSEIARSATPSRRISKATILDVSKKLLERNITRFNQYYPKVFKIISQNVVAKNIIINLYAKGIGQIHNWDDVSNTLDVSAESKQIEDAICQLVEIEFLTRTGYDGEVLFVTNPTLAHTIAAVINNPQKYSVPRSFVMNNNQFVLPFLKKGQNGPE